MLSALRAGTPIYLLYKDGMRYAAGTVQQVSGQYPNTALNYQQPFAPGSNILVDISVDVGGKTETFQRIPLNSSVAEFPEKGILVSETREGIINEVTAMRNTRVAAIQQMPTLQREVEACDNLLLELNPQLKREQEQAREIDNLKQQLAGMSDQIAALTGMISKSLGKKKEE